MNMCLKHIGVLLVLFIRSIISYAQTPTIDCSAAAAQQLTVGTTCTPINYVISGAIGLPAIPACNGGTSTGQDGWFWFTATATNTVLQVTNANRDAVVYVYTGTCGALTLFDCTDYYIGSPSTETLVMPTTIGQNYFVRIVRYTGTGGSMNGTICVFSPPPVVNDNCANAIPISCGATLSGTTIGATTETVPAACYSTNTSPSVWYTFTGAGDNVTLSLCSGTTFDTQLAVFSGTCGSLSCYSANDDGCGSQSTVTINACLGVTYYVRVSGWGNNIGTFQLSMTCTAPTLVNDACCGAINLTCPQTVTGNTSTAGNDALPGGCYIGSAGKGVWYQFTGNGGSMTVSTCGSAFDTQLSVLAGSCSGFSCVGYNDEFCGSQSQVTVSTAAGTTYYVCLFGYLGASGTFTLNLSCGTPFNNTCSDLEVNGCPDIDLGSDISVPNCISPCSTTMNLTAQYFETGTTTAYQVCSVPYLPYPYNSGTGFSIGVDDVYTGIITLPFNFCFFGASYNQCIVGSNGVITFNIGNAGGYCPFIFNVPIPNATLPTNSIFGIYQDIDPSIYCGSALCGDARYATFGSSPCRVFVVSYDNLPLYSSSCNNLKTTCQIALYETTNVIEVFIENKPVCGTWNYGNSLVGIQNAAGTIGYAPQGRNTGDWIASNEGWRFIPSGPSNVSIAWYDQNGQIGTGSSVSICPAAASQTYVATATYTQCNGATVIVTDDVNVVCATLQLPVEWLSFDVFPAMDGLSNQLKWITATEVNNDSFTVQRSLDAVNWQDIGTVDGSGNSLTEKSYVFIDKSSPLGLCYYRIRQTDYNGERNYSEIRSISRTGSTALSLYPNPAAQKVAVQPWTQTSEITLLDHSGRTLPCTWNQLGEIDLSGIPSGSYFVVVKDSFSGVSERLRLMVTAQ
jgi:hypothetical protein